MTACVYKMPCLFLKIETTVSKVYKDTSKNKTEKNNNSNHTRRDMSIAINFTQESQTH